MSTLSRARIGVACLSTAALTVGALATGVTGAAASLPAELLVSVVTPQFVHNINAVPSGAGAPTKVIGSATDVAVSRDGTQLVFQQILPTGSQWVLAGATGQVTRRLFTTEPSGCTTPDWSPDATTILFSCAVTYPFGSYAALTVVQVVTGSSKRILPQGRFADTTARWSPRGDLIAFTRLGGPGQFSTYGNNRSRLMLVRPDGTGLTALAAAATLSEHSPTFAPDGLSVAFVTRAFEAQTVPVTQEDLAVARVSDGMTTRISQPAGTGVARYLIAPTYSPDGSTIAALETTNALTYPVLSKVALVSVASGTTTYAASGSTQNASGLSWRAARTAVTGTTPTPTARVVPVAASQRVTAVPAGVVDGPVAYTVLGLGIVVAPAPGDPSITLSPTKGPSGLVSQFGGGGFTYDRNTPSALSTYEIRSEPASGVGAVTIYTSANRCAPRTWLNATTLGVDCLDATVGDRFWGTLNTTTQTISMIHRAPAYPPADTWLDSEPTWSRDGTTIAFTRKKADGSASRVMLMTASGANIRAANPLPVTADSGDHGPAWTPQGDLVIATSRFAMLDPVYHEDLALTRRTFAGMFRLTSPGAVGNVRKFAAPTVAPSGTRLLVHEITGVQGDGGGKSHPVVVSLSPTGLGGAATVPLFAQQVVPASFGTAWSQG